VRSIFRLVFVVVPTAALATAVVVGVSRSGEGAAATSDGELQRDLKLASATSLELAPAGRPLATVSSIEAPPAATPERKVRPKRSSSGTRAVRSRARVVPAAPEPRVAEAAEESEAVAATELAAAENAGAEAAAGGVALPRPTAIPVSFPAPGGGETYDPGPGSVIRGGVLDGDHCQIHRRGGRPVYGPPIFGRPTATRGSVGERVRGVQRSGEARRGSGSVATRVREAQGSRPSGGTNSGGRGSVGARVRGVRG
jgi:hypothetical protein